jgi:glycosyltransferase involved in cell wall biosynthesis
MRSIARAKAAQILGFDGEYLLVVGQNQPSKGHEVALRAFAAAGTGRFRLVFVQRLSAGRGLANWVRDQRLGDQVRFVSYLEQEAFLAVLQCARVLLQPSYDEGFGLPALEAAACGCPVIASDIDALREILGDAAAYAEKGNIEAWRQAIEQLSVEDELDSSCRAKLHERACAFSWDRTARDTLGVYREVIAEMTRSGPF